MRTSLTLAALLGGVPAGLLRRHQGRAKPPPGTPDAQAGDTSGTAAGVPAARQPPAGSLEAAVAAGHRRPEDRARDKYRHPEQTLAFFGLKPRHERGGDLARAGLVHRHPGALPGGEGPP